MALLHLLSPLDPLLLAQCCAALGGLLLHARAPSLPAELEEAVIAASPH